jgi:hypothetical protein
MLLGDPDYLGDPGPNLLREIRDHCFAPPRTQAPPWGVGSVAGRARSLCLPASWATWAPGLPPGRPAEAARATYGYLSIWAAAG